MAVVLVVADDLAGARQMAQALRRTGHTPILVPKARAALQDAIDGPDIILLDLRLSDRSEEELLRRLGSLPETTHIPVVVVTGGTEVATRLETREAGNVVAVLRAPVSDAQLGRTVNAALEGRRRGPVPEALRLAQHRRRELVRRLIAEGPDRIAFHVYRRLSADRATAGPSGRPWALSWAEIAEWARLEGLLDEEQASLLAGGPAAGAHEAREDS